MRSIVLGGVLLGLALATARSGAAADRAFVPERHFPARTILYLSVENVSRLESRLSETLVGRIVTHPGWRAALAKPLAEARKKAAGAWEPFVEVTGRSPPEVLDLLRGRVALAVVGLGVGFPEAALAVELPVASRTQILDVLTTARRSLEARSGKNSENREVGSFTATVWTTPGGPIFQVVLGDHVLMVTSHDLLRTIVAACEGRALGPGLGESRFYRELAAPLNVPDRQVLLAVDLEAVRTLLTNVLAPPGSTDQVRNVLRFSGLDALSSLGCALGFRGDGAEPAFYLGARDGTRGALRVLQEAFPALDGVDAAIDEIPAGATEVQAFACAPGKALRAAKRLLGQHIPELDLETIQARFTKRTGLSVEEDLQTLGPISVFLFVVPPPAGGLFADRLALVRTDALSAYWQLLEKIATALGDEIRTLDLGGVRLRHAQLGRRLFADGSALGDLLTAGASAPAGVNLLAPLLLVSGEVSRRDLPGGWTLLSSRPQAIVRYETVYSRGRRMSDDVEFAARLRSRLAGASLASVSRGGTALLAGYNSLLGIGDFLAAPLAAAGVDLAQAPPAEEFLEYVRPGHLEIVCSPHGFVVRGHRPFVSSNSVLNAAAGAAVVAGLAASFSGGDGRAD